LLKIRRFHLDQVESAICRLTGVLKELHSLCKDEVLSQERSNIIAKLESEALGLTLKLPKSKIEHIFWKATVKAVRRLVVESSDDEREKRLD
jgi:hypothetical protein